MFLELLSDIYEQLKFNLYQDDAVTGKSYFPYTTPPISFVDVVVSP